MTEISEQRTPAIEIEGVWKIFGDRHLEAMAAIENAGSTKQHGLEQYD